LDCVVELASGHLFIPVVAGMFETALAAAPWFVLVDARMRKHAIPDCQRGLAPLTIGFGPVRCAC
jgi:xanthine dehydrogenase accessory factor